MMQFIIEFNKGKFYARCITDIKLFAEKEVISLMLILKIDKLCLLCLCPAKRNRPMRILSRGIITVKFPLHKVYRLSRFCRFKKQRNWP